MSLYFPKDSKLSLGAWSLVLVAAAHAQSPDSEFFEKKIRPVLATNCYACHSSKLKSPMGGLLLDTKEGLATVVSPGKPAASAILRALRYTDPQIKMPPMGKLPDPVIADFETWIAAGAPDPRAASATPAITRGIDFDRGRQWWAFQPVKPLAAPAVKNTKWPATKIDSFVLAQLEHAKLAPSPEADPRTLIRRVYLDLTGLKPTYEQIEAYAADPSPDRYQKLVDHLLASPQYGERWARYWMDVMRYAEENGSGGQYLFAWRYRDWLIEALNKDLPYNQFLKLQLAADQVPGATRDDLRALGFLGVSPVEHKELKLAKDMIQTLMLDEWDERVDVVSRGMMGLTVACSRCHDHKFDPISQKDYYAMAGVFASTSAANRPLLDVDPEVEKRFLWNRQRFNDLKFGINTLTGNQDAHQDLAVVKVKEYREEQDKVRAELLAIQQSTPALADSIEKVINPPKEPKGAKARPDDPNAPFINAVWEAGLWLDGSHPDITLMDFRPGQAHDLPIYSRGNGASPGDTLIPRRFLTVLAKNPGEPYQHGSGRIDLAEKIVTDAAPLTARVIVNRVWGWHFDKHLVATPSDFGDRGEKPTHPELLDDLAARFMANGWSLKWLHREILLSATYRQSSRPRADAVEADPENRLLWRMNPRRIDIESFRDSLLESSGLLDPKIGGPPMDLESPANTRRTIYGKIARLRSNDMLRAYDFPIPMQHSPSRVQTITPLQQFFVMNSQFIEKLSQELAKSAESAPDAAAKVRALYRKTLGRDPAPGELDSALTYINHAPLARFAQVLLASNEEIFWP
ncbi:MAG: hypothetical protein JWP63_6508 [Candidatus Solibacter sp.]|nr:hypothetical protein [Candidatus Solibacter sp.]